MDLSYSPREEAFRQRVREFLDANLPRGWGSPTFVMPKGEAYTEFLRDWQSSLYDNGFLGLEWPKEYGGQDASLIESAIFGEEQARARAPQPLNVVGLFLTGPTLLAHGTEQQKSRHLRKILLRRDLVPGIFRTGFGLGSRLTAHPGRA
jgi:alkylation response protein AidB-like acyl-CoA dehydrogenase